MSEKIRLFVVKKKCRNCNVKFVLSPSHHLECDLCPPCNEDYEHSLRVGMDKYEEEKMRTKNAD